ncbi:MAG: hypothetical protein AAFY45_34590 [Bacteroidota bacterium]
MKNNITIYLPLLICLLLSHQGLKAQEKSTAQSRNNILSIGNNYSFIPKWKSHSIYNPQLSYERIGIQNRYSIWLKISVKVACTQCNTDYIISGQGDSGIQLLPSQNTPTDIRHQNYSLYLGVNPFMNATSNLNLYLGPTHRRGSESYYLGYSFNGSYYEIYNDLRQANDWGLGTAVKYQIAISKLLKIAIISEYQYYPINKAENNYEFQAAKQEFFLGLNLGVKI